MTKELEAAWKEYEAAVREYKSNKTSARNIARLDAAEEKIDELQMREEYDSANESDFRD